MKRLGTIILFMVLAVIAMAQRPCYGKMSPMLRSIVMKTRGEWNGGQSANRVASVAEKNAAGQGSKAADGRRMLLLARIDGDAENVLADYGGRLHAQLGGVSVVSLPVSALGSFSTEHSVRRMETGSRCQATLDSTALHVNALPVYAGTNLPQAYTGSGVVLGLQDIGFDLTHPTFYDTTMTRYRIKALWDQLARDRGDGRLLVGRDYVGEEALLACARSYDGTEQTHGTQTLGIAAGTGYDTPYRGLAWDSDICLVANATTNNANLIPDSLLYLYDSTADLLGFKYIFDYAESVGKPCVISFSEGSMEDLVGEDKLIYEALDAMTGPGRIIVASAGNIGTRLNYYKKPQGVASAGSFVSNGSRSASFTLNTNAPFAVRMVVYSQHPDTITYDLRDADIDRSDTLALEDGEYVFMVSGYESPYHAGECSYTIDIQAPHNVGSGTPLSVELVGEDADAEFFATGIGITTNSLNTSLSSGECSHGILSPGSAPSVICVGATSYRRGVVNEQGDWQSVNWGDGGVRADYSSMGPTYDRRIKPDVVAPGTLIISSLTSHIAEFPAWDWGLTMRTRSSVWNGRTYGWSANAGTSSSTPVVSGAIALWLQANPNLSPDDILDILSLTGSHNDNTLSYPNNEYGYGEIDVYAGLIEVLRRQATGLRSLSTHQPSAISHTYIGGRLTLHLSQASSSPVSLRVYSVSGTLVMRETIPAGSASYTLDLTPLPAGVYAIQADGKEPSLRGSLLVRNQ